MNSDEAVSFPNTSGMIVHGVETKCPGCEITKIYPFRDFWMKSPDMKLDTWTDIGHLPCDASSRAGCVITVAGDPLVMTSYSLGDWTYEIKAPTRYGVLSISVAFVGFYPSGRISGAIIKEDTEIQIGGQKVILASAQVIDQETMEFNRHKSFVTTFHEDGTIARTKIKGGATLRDTSGKKVELANGLFQDRYYMIDLDNQGRLLGSRELE